MPELEILQPELFDIKNPVNLAEIASIVLIAQAIKELANTGDAYKMGQTLIKCCHDDPQQVIQVLFCTILGEAKWLAQKVSGEEKKRQIQAFLNRAKSDIASKNFSIEPRINPN